MSNKDERIDDSREADFRELLKSAGRGPRLSAEARQRIRARVEATWHETLAAKTGEHEASSEPANRQGAHGRIRRQSRSAAHTSFARRRRRLRWLVPSAAAAAAALVAVLFIGSPDVAPPSAQNVFAQVVVTDGPVTIERDGSILSIGTTRPADVRVGDRISTGAAGRLALTLPSGEELRLNANTTIDVASAASVRLAAGMVYFDAPPQLPRSEFAVTTQFGTVSHLGTQYVAAVAESGLSVRVREGRAQIREIDSAAGAASVAADVGEAVQVDPSGAATRMPFAVDHPDWQWTEELARAPFADRSTVLELLQWTARATGREIRWASDATMARAQDVTLNRISGLSPAEVIGVINSTTNIDVSESSGTLTVTMR